MLLQFFRRLRWHASSVDSEFERLAFGGMRKIKYLVLIVLALLCVATPAVAHVDSENTSLTLQETTTHFQQNRFGMFVHWGLYSVMADGEWVMNDKKIPAA